jgi:hypothetical protein
MSGAGMEFAKFHLGFTSKKIRLRLPSLGHGRDTEGEMLHFHNCYDCASCLGTLHSPPKAGDFRRTSNNAVVGSEAQHRNADVTSALAPLVRADGVLRCLTDVDKIEIDLPCHFPLLQAAYFSF